MHVVAKTTTDFDFIFDRQMLVASGFSRNQLVD